MRPTDLVPGNCYFTVAFWDADRVFPMIETLRYVAYEETPDGLASAIRRLLDGSGPESLTITIRYTDEGVSLTKEEKGELLLRVFPGPRFNPEVEAKLRRILSASGLVPERDYLSSRGRVRVLVYPVQPNVDGLAALCKRMFEDAYDIRAGDTLRYRWRSERREAAEKADAADEAQGGTRTAS